MAHNDLNVTVLHDSLQRDIQNMAHDDVNITVLNDSLQRDTQNMAHNDLNVTVLHDSLQRDIQNMAHDDVNITVQNDSLQRDIQNMAHDDLSITVLHDSLQRDIQNMAHDDLNITVLHNSLQRDLQSTEFDPVVNNHDYSNAVDDEDAKVIVSKMFEIMRSMKPSTRRPVMSMLATLLSKKKLDKYMGQRISSHEFADARKHASIHGMLRCVPEVINHRRRNCLPEHLITHFIEWCQRNNIFQNVAYGQKVLKFSNGIHIAAESIKSRVSCSNIRSQYVKEWMAEEEANSSEQNDENRCHHTCPNSGVRCIKQKDHNDRHRYTPKDRLSGSTIEKIIKQLTNGQMKSLKGLDVIDTEKGHDNFENMRQIVATLIELGRFGRERCTEGDMLIQDIDKVEEFHKVGYPQHLGAEGK
jgi:hypothetical protein